jgi:hypothetical protein
MELNRTKKHRCWKNLTASLESFKDQSDDGKQILTFTFDSDQKPTRKMI